MKWRFGKEWELSLKLQGLEENRKKSQDGSGPSEIKSLAYPYEKMLYLIAEEYLLSRLYGYNTLFDYYIDETDDGDIEEEKGNHFHISFDRKIPNYNFYIVLYVLLQTKYRNLLCRYKFRNTANRWAYNYLIKPERYNNTRREYLIITPNQKNKKRTLELRLSEFTVINDLIIFLIAKHIYEKFEIYKMNEYDLYKIAKELTIYESNRKINDCYNLYYFLKETNKTVEENYTKENFDRIYKVLEFLFPKQELEYNYMQYNNILYLAGQEPNKALQELEKNIDKILISLTYVYAIENRTNDYMQFKIYTLLKPLFKTNRLKNLAKRVMLSFI
jgi:hypothetical protein